MTIDAIVYDLFVILVAGWIAGVVAKRLGFSMLVGYLLAGALIGHSAFGLVAENVAEIEHLAHVGALLLLFAIGIEFSLEDLLRLSRYFVVGGSLQMVLVAVPTAMAFVLLDLPWPAAVLLASAVALSSTVVVYRALTEWGESASPAGRRAIGVLLFQDVALVPLMLLVPLLKADGGDGLASTLLYLAIKSMVFIAAVLALRRVFARWFVPLLIRLRSIELIVLFALAVLVGFCLGAHAAGLPAAMGAFAAGLVLSGNRLTHQIDALILPYRESFGAVFFVSLGMLLDPSILLVSAPLLIAGLAAVLAIKAGAATIALRVTGLPWRASAGMGLGLAQLGELSFMLLSEGLHENIITQQDYDRMLFIAMGSLILTPQLLQLGLRWIRRSPSDDQEPTGQHKGLLAAPREAIVIGLGPIGRRAASQLEIMGIDVCLIDSSPVNLYAYAQQGFRTVSGNAVEREVLDRADAAHCRLAVVCVPDDRAATQIVKAMHAMNPKCTIIVRCRYQAHSSALKKAGAQSVISEESETSLALLRLLEQLDRP